jgi:hypothetical protein
VRVSELAWPDQRTAARQLGLGPGGPNELKRARESGRLPEHYWTRRRHRGKAGAGVRYHYDVEGILADPELRCVRPGCEALALRDSKRCKKDALWGKKPDALAIGTAAAARQREQQLEPFRSKGLLTSGEVVAAMGAASHVSLIRSYRPAGLQPTRVETIAGREYQLYLKSRLVDFQGKWARGGDGHRRLWWSPKHAVAAVSGRGDRSARAVRDAEQRARARHAALVDFLRTGRPRSAEAEERHRAWAELYADLRDWHERQEAANGHSVPSHFALCLEVARLHAMDHPEDWDYEPEMAHQAAAARVSRALKRLQTLRT